MPLDAAGYGSSEDPAWCRIDWSSHERTTEVAGRSIHYVDLGEGGTPCLFLHGIGNSWRFWLETLPRLAERRRVLAVDLPGFGESHMPDGPLTATAVARTIDQLCQQLGITRLAVCGHSMGGLAALQMAAGHVERVDKLILVGAALISVTDLYRGPLGPLRQPRLALTYASAVLTAAVPTPSWISNAIAGSKLARNTFLRTYVTHPLTLSTPVLRQALRGLGRPGVLAAVLNRERFNLRDVGRQAKVPVLLVNGDQDRFSPVRDVELLAGEMHEAEVVILADTGHWPMLERPDVFNGVLEDFLGN
jgi:pimeloyl-ACP methyl ester carboxylesterase